MHADALPAWLEGKGRAGPCRFFGRIGRDFEIKVGVEVRAEYLCSHEGLGEGETEEH
jgi:hypothetical protein